MEIFSNSLDPRDCQNLIYSYSLIGHDLTGNLDVITDSRFCNMIS